MNEISVRLAVLVNDLEALPVIVDVNALGESATELVTLHWQAKQYLERALMDVRRCASILREASRPDGVDQEA